MKFTFLHRTTVQKLFFSNTIYSCTLIHACFAAMILIFVPSAATAEEPTIGLLTLPEVLGDGACDKFSPQEIPLYPAMDAKKAYAVIRVDKYWTYPEAGGCEGLSVNIHENEGQGVSTLITKEFTYEAPAAIVIQNQNDWYKIRTSDGSAWINATERDQYYSLESLLTDSMCYVASTFGISVYSHPGDDDAIGLASSGDTVRVLKALQVGDQLWLHIQVLNSSICDAPEQHQVELQGWTPAHTPSGSLAVWFYSRGC